MNLLRRAWSFLSLLGPAPADGGGTAAPAAGAKKEPVEPRELDRGPFDPDDGEGGDAEPEGEEEQPGSESEEEAGDSEPESDEEGGDEETEQDGSEDEEEGDDEEDDEDLDDDLDADDDDTAQMLRETWETRLAAEPAPAAPRLNIDKAALRAEARKRFDDIRSKDKDEDGASDADAMFEVALDAALQVVGSYHSDVATQATERTDKALRNVQVSRTLAAFKRELGDRLTPAIETRMAEVYTELARTHGWRKADKVPLKQLYRMAGGRMKGKTQKDGKTAGDDKARKQKKEALAAAGGPRNLGRTRPEGKKQPKDRALVEFAQDVRERRPFFTLPGGR